jgi:transcriptional regulator with XRE-family HTH domain
MNTYQEIFIKNLKYYRTKKNYSQAELAELCSVSTGTIGNIECGLAKPSFDLIISIGKNLDIEPALLFASESFWSAENINNPDYELLHSIYQSLDNRFTKPK